MIRPNTFSASRSGFRHPAFLLGAAFLIAVVAVMADPAGAAICSIPGTHASIAAGVADLNCSEIELAAQTYTESLVIPRSLSLHGPAAGGALLAGNLLAVGNTVLLLSHLAIRSGCPDPPLLAKDGARIAGSGVSATREPGAACPGPLFADGFESGNFAAWSLVVPSP